jgi:hypothetical protein
MAKNAGKLGRDDRIGWGQKTFVATIRIPFFSAAFPGLLIERKNLEIYILHKFKKIVDFGKLRGQSWVG